MVEQITMRPMSRQEVDLLVDWAAQEDWNPGLHDAEIFWQTDPRGFIAAERAGEMIGGGAIISYDGRFGFMGFFIMQPAWRGQGLGDRLWQYRKQTLLARLAPPPLIGMDGVFAMQPYYARGGFQLFTRDLRFEGVAAALADGLLPLWSVPFEQILAYDSGHFPAPRPTFLQQWITQPDSRALGAVHAGVLRGYGVVRACRQGYKIGPLFAADVATAEALFCGLGDYAQGAPLCLDVPEINTAALALAQRHHMREVFGCARMYLGNPPDLPHAEIFGVTTLEPPAILAGATVVRSIRLYGQSNPAWPCRWPWYAWP